MSCKASLSPALTATRTLRHSLPSQSSCPQVEPQSTWLILLTHHSQCHLSVVTKQTAHHSFATLADHALAAKLPLTAFGGRIGLSCAQNLNNTGRLPSLAGLSAHFGLQKLMAGARSGCTCRLPAACERRTGRVAASGTQPRVPVPQPAQRRPAQRAAWAGWGRAGK